jgi:phosphohistidine phosphatase
MKKQLFLLRHAKSSWKDLSLPDHDRPLNKRGRKAAAAMRRLFRSEGVNPDLICVSSAVRTMQTLEVLEPWDEQPEVKVENALYLATAPQILERLRAVPDSTRAVFVIGHNPGLQELAVLLISREEHLPEDALPRRVTESFPTGALAEFSLDCSWSRIGRGSGRLKRFVTPRELE